MHTHTNTFSLMQQENVLRLFSESGEDEGRRIAMNKHLENCREKERVFIHPLIGAKIKRLQSLIVVSLSYSTFSYTQHYL
jgi:hypothetical protein